VARSIRMIEDRNLAAGEGCLWHVMANWPQPDCAGEGSCGA
jgi:hypothetical protein